jgi:hypothetical protein
MPSGGASRATPARFSRSQKYPQHELEYAYEALSRAAADFGERVVLIAGPKVGLGPTLVLLYLFIADKIMGLSYGNQWAWYLPIAGAALTMATTQIKCPATGAPRVARQTRCGLQATRRSPLGFRCCVSVMSVTIWLVR